jgi:hypothetical protein
MSAQGVRRDVGDPAKDARGAGDAWWYVLGFDYDQVVGAYQDWRLAREFAQALGVAAPALLGDVLEVAGDGAHLIFWYLSPAAAEVLDARGVEWRRFYLGRRAMPPTGATPPLKRA